MKGCNDQFYIYVCRILDLDFDLHPNRIQLMSQLKQRQVYTDWVLELPAIKMSISQRQQSKFVYLTLKEPENGCVKAIVSVSYPLYFSKTTLENFCRQYRVLLP